MMKRLIKLMKTLPLAAMVAALLAGRWAFAEKPAVRLGEIEDIPQVERVTRLSVSGAFSAVYDAQTGLWQDSVSGETLYAPEVEELAQFARDIEWHTLVMEAADEAVLAAFGLGDAQATVIRAEGEGNAAREILIGTADEDGNRYARLPGSRMVYTVEGESVLQLLGAGVHTLWNKTPVTLPFAQLVCAQFTWAGGILQIDGGAVESDNPYELLWARLTGLFADERVAQDAQGDALFTVAYADVQGKPSEIAVYAYDTDYCLLSVGNAYGLLVDAKDVDAILNMLDVMR